MKVLCSTGALGGKGNLPDCEKLIELYTKINLDGYELLISSNWKEQSRDWCLQLEKSQINIPMIHFSKKIGDNFSKCEESNIKMATEIFESNCKIAQMLSVSKCVLHLWGWPDTNFDKTIREYLNICEIAKNYNIEILIELVPCKEMDMLSKVEALLSLNPKCRFTLDTRFLCYQGLLDEIFEYKRIWENNSVAHIHVSDCIKDEDGNVLISPILHPNDGIINFEKFITNLKIKGYDGYITIESLAWDKENNRIDLDKLNSTIEYIKSIWEK